MNQQRYTVLIVDDSPEDREMYRRYLQRPSGSPYDVLEADCGQQGLHLWQSHHPDVVLLDYSLPDINGLEFLSCLQASTHCPDLPVIVVTGEGSEAIAVSLMKAGTQDYLVKGHLTPEVLRVAVNATITNRHLQQKLQQSEEIRQFSEARYHAIVEDQAELVCRFLPNGLLTFVNQAYSRYFGLPISLLIGNRFLDLVSPADYSRVQQQLADLAELTPEQPILIQEHQVLKPDGQVGWQHWVNRGIFDAQGHLAEIQAVGWDISDRKQTEAALRESERRYTLLAETPPVVILRWDCTGQCLYVNHQWSQFTHRPPQEALGWGWTTPFHPDDRDRLLTAWNHWCISQSSPVLQNEGRILRPDGTIVWFYSQIKPETDTAGHLIGFIGSWTDITALKQAEVAMQEREEQFRTLADNISQLAWMADTSGYIFWYNHRWFEYTGTTLEQVQGWGWKQVHHPDHFERVEEHFRRSIVMGEQWEDTFPLRGKDGTYRWFLSRALPIRNDAGKIVRWFGTNTDIDDRQQAELRLQEHNLYLSLLYQTTHNLLSTVEPLQLIDQLFHEIKDILELDVYFNYFVDDELKKLHLSSYYGIAEGIAKGIEWLDYGTAICGAVAQSQRPIVQFDVQQCTDERAALIRSMGVTAYISQPLISRGRLLGTLSFGSYRRSSLTPTEVEFIQSLCDQIAIALERSQLIHSLQQQNKRLERANQIKDDFLAVLSHELRSPLNPILGWANLLQTQSLDAKTAAQALASIERNARLQTQLIDDLLDIARILRGKLRMEMVPVHLITVVESAIDTVKPAAAAKSIHLQAVLPDIGWVRGDATRLQQIIWNLLSNAVKFTPAGGQVTIYLEPIDQQAQMTIQDTGKGINPSFLPHIFESFRQEDVSTTRQHGGLGLGLSIVRHLVEAHGGTITANSSGENQGATFTVRIPLLSLNPDLRSFPAASQKSLTLQGIRVLVVDDEADSRDLLMVLLEQYEADVKTVGAAATALAVLDTFQPHLIISDIGMPDMDGYNLLRQIRSRPPAQGGQIPAIALTAYAGEANQQQALTAGFQHHLTKPVDVQPLIETIQRLVSHG